MLVDGTDLGLVRIEVEPRFTGSQANQSSCVFTMAAGIPPVPPAHVELVNGSPMLVVEGQPVLWYENWLRNREVRRGV